MDKILFLCFSALVLTGCKNSGDGVMVAPVNNTWAKNKAQTFTFEIKDAQQPKNIIFVVRNNNDYPYSNLRLISVLKQDKNKVLKTDTLNYILAKPNGEWVGSGFGDTKETEFQYKLNYRFPANGKYSLEVKQAMRKDILPGIEDLGIKIDNATP